MYRFARFVARVGRCRRVLPVVVGPVLPVVAGVGVRAPFAGFHNSRIQRFVQLGLGCSLLVGLEIAAQPVGVLGFGRTCCRLAAVVGVVVRALRIAADRWLLAGLVVVFHLEVVAGRVVNNLVVVGGHLFLHLWP